MIEAMIILSIILVALLLCLAWRVAWAVFDWMNEVLKVLHEIADDHKE